MQAIWTILSHLFPSLHLMANVWIWYFFEGTDAHGSVVIPRDAYIDELTKEIFNDWSLVLLKVS